jgi:prevent-host-death family protein
MYLKYLVYMKTKSTSTSSARVAVREARISLAELLNRVAYQGERIVLHRRGKDAAALVPVEDLRLIQELEDRIDVEEAKRILAEMKKTGERPIPWSRARKQLGL